MPFSKERASEQHGGIGIKMSFVCDLLENIEKLQAHEEKAVIQEDNLYINIDVFFGLIRVLDVYVFELYTILDYLAVELSDIFDLKIKKHGREKDVGYFMELIDAENLREDIRNLIKDLIKESWFDYFHRLRNRVTHRTPINFPAILTFQEGKYTSFQYPLLPDNPDEITLTFSEKREVLAESKKWLECIFAFVDDVSKTLLSLFQTSL